MESTVYVLIKIIAVVVIVVVILMVIFYLLKTSELSYLATKENIDFLYDKIDYGDVLQLRLSTLAGRMVITPVAQFFHHAIVVKLPNDDNKYIFHTRNKAIKPFLHPELKYNTKRLGYKDNYQLVELKNYLYYIANKKEYFILLKSPGKIDYTMNVDDTIHLESWSNFRHCGYLMLTFMKRNGWIKQEVYEYTNLAYYITPAIQERLIDFEQYTYTGIFFPSKDKCGNYFK
jgi:hypothetical protein